ncbi:hypothetical protein BGZ61DRAFT_526228 [Ilyonectria robusta]|uniref:uncharacterized protein n=1 Tax=Ilyonectria robusta TaxID=1079257 RepID=UPI001E8CFBCE|nr:uncharacterized protein BGZ61DRAFT_526228 [Ilyonectria robusta]KAH8738235.1 hypothetical protein BGZ61DRAFT_526228 [Ilyonectria robusta]
MKVVISPTLACVVLNAGAAFASPAMAGYLTPRHVLLQERAGNECGEGIGSCDAGSCCSESGYCGTETDYCAGSDCQLDYSDSCDTFFGPGGTSTESIARPKIGNVPYGSPITTCVESGMIALTFDDGPYTYTSEILDLLDEYDVKATFMIAGNNRGKGHIDDSSLDWPGVLRRMYAAGHHITSHTWTHRNLNQVNSTIKRSEMIYNEMALRNVFGWIPTYMRPPYLECSASSGCQSLMGELGYHVVSTDLDTKDWEYDSSMLIQNAKDRFSAGVSTNPASNSYIVLAHDVHEQTVTNLTAYMIRTAQDRGYKLVTLGECLGDPVANWYRQAPGGTPAATSSASSGASSTRSRSSSSATATSGVVISPNQKCGGDTGYTCIGSGFGNCCSHYGYCGFSDNYCGTGCDVDFGECNSTSEDVTDTTNGLCGAGFHSTCSNYGTKTCCSQYGYCGSSSAHCGTGCQSGFGTCN